MSYICDWCGEEIRSDRLEDGVAQIVAYGRHADRWACHEPAGHFHAGDRDDDDTCLLQALRLLADHCKTSRPVSPRQQRAREAAERRQAEETWRQTPRERREILLLHALGDEQLIIRELAGRMNAELGYGARKRAIAEYEVRPLVMRMFRAGQLEREPETFNKTHTRYRYSRRRKLQGPIIDLERAYNADSEAGA